MIHKSWVYISFFLIFFVQVFCIQAQTFQKKVALSWRKNLNYKIDDDFSLEYLNFDEAVSDEQFDKLPVFFSVFAVDNFFSDYQIQLKNEKYETLSPNDRKLVRVELIDYTPVTKVRCVAENKRYYALVTVLPFVKDASGSVRKLLSFDIELSVHTSKTKASKASDYASSSVLATGTWYRLGVQQTGIHKLTFENLQSMGMSSASLPSANLSVFGNGMGMLSERNGVERPDDLLEIPVAVYDGGDGNFGPGDYLLFYASSPHAVILNQSDLTFSHQQNIYSDYSYYFINVNGVGEHKRIETITPSSSTFASSVSDYLCYKYYEKDEINIAQTGRKWFTDLYDVTLQRNYNFYLPSVKNQPARVSLSVANLAPNGISSQFGISINSSMVGVMSMSGSDAVEAKFFENSYSFVPTQSELAVTLKLSRASSTAKCYLDWIAIQALCNLNFGSGQMPFNNAVYAQTAAQNQYVISNASAAMEVWNVSSIDKAFRIQGNLSGSQFTFINADTSYSQFIAFDESALLIPELVGSVSNQNLHSAESQVDMIIVAHPDFMSQAEDLASYRRQNQHITVRVVTPQQVYNEFSSGMQDPVAIRDYMKMIYEKSGGLYPKYLLLFGRPSYDYRGLVSGTQLFVPNWQCPDQSSVSEGSFRSNDDFFAVLDDGEGEMSYGMLDISVGRFPVSTAAQANMAVSLSKNYSAKTNLLPASSTKISNLADWRNVIAFVADDGDDNAYFSSAENCAALIQNANANINLDKIYCDAYQQISNSGGQRYPEVNKAINNRMSMGSLFFTYIGHSGKDGWAHERILEFSDIYNWKNTYNQPVMMTMSCDFGWYDRASISPAEACFFNENGGAAALITTSRVAYGPSNDTYARRLFASLFTPVDGRCRTIGEANKKAKNDAGGNTSGISMIYVIGDPSMPLAIPQYDIVTDSVNGMPVTALNDTLKALSQVIIKGHIADAQGNLKTDFNGNVYTSVFDKKVTMSTLANDPDESEAESFDVQKNILFKGNNTVSNGRFELKFIVPADINYAYGNGKFSYYARGNQSDATGSFTNFIIGGTSGQTYDDKEGPQIDLYLNDENFAYGGITNQNPILIVHLQDKLGINTTGNGIGHDLVAILDDNNDSQIVLNDHYEANQDSANCGSVRYQLPELAAGPHKLKIRAWDILNNVSEKEIEFTVANDEKLTLEHVLNYPNPFTTNTAFYFEHNHPGESMDILIQIFTISGKLIKTISTNQFMEGNRSSAICWDGRDDYGDRLGRGTYIYRLKVRLSDGSIAENMEKIVIL